MKRLVPIILLPLLLVAGTASAALDRMDIDQLMQNVWKVRTAFHTYTVMQGDATYMERLEEVIADTDDVVSDLNESAQEGDDQAFMELVNESWERYRGFAEGNTFAEMGYTDHYTILDLENEALALHRLIDQRRQDVSGKAEDLTDLAIRLQRLASEYMYTAAAPDAGAAGGTGAESGRIEFVDAVPDFDARLSAIQKVWAGNPDISRELRSVASKWAFIRESLVKFYENSVPFVVQRYSEQMVESINTAAEMAGE
ncbi:hypothetical protein [Alcanivorax sp. 1008]|uniref:hypothetical protein n=1 Tax=Alcanivorax sp. 1008 TaxID=2816853 RepID=UPI001E162BAB|nr:hypothetical protein [Alcanivorax sp. 1008]MCC1498023.1 hypothetical protein [Alcanivorax sp. 1008]